MTSKCDAHQINTTGKRASGTSSHVTNLNPVLGKSLTLLHTTLNRVTNSAARMSVYKGVQKENNRKEFPVLATSVKTRWNSEHKEADIAAANQDDLSIALDRMICDTGIDRELFKTNEDNLAKVKPTNVDWIMYQQYACGIAPLKQFSEFSQSSQVIFHNELFEARMAMERLGANYYPMKENLSAMKRGGRGANLKLRERNQVVIKEDFLLSDEVRNKFKANHVMEKPIAVCRHVAV